MSLSGLNQYNPHLPFAPPPPPLPPQEEPPRSRKQTRITRACDFCHSRSTKCKQNPIKGEPCLVCLDFSQPCTYNRPIKKRGIPGKAYKPPPAESTPNSNAGAARDGESDARMLLELTNGIQGAGVSNIIDSFTIPEKWKGMLLANEAKVKDLIEIYHEVIHPLHPLFHYPTLKARMENREYLTDLSFFAEVVAICALAALKATDRSLLTGRWTPDHFNIPHDAFFDAARDVIQKMAGELSSLAWMRTYAIMALFGLQVGKKAVLHHYLGLYHSLVSVDSLDDEENWPKEIDVIEVEVRRRLFWTMYSVEVFTSVVFGSRMRVREAHTNVSYPSEVDDAYIATQGYGTSESPSPFFTNETVRNPMCWLHGWNFNTDLYRLCERTSNIAPRQKRPTGNALPFSQSPLILSDSNQALEEVMALHATLPPHFKGWKQIPSSAVDGLSDSFGLQAANILVTLQLLRIVIENSTGAEIQGKAEVSSTVLEILPQVPLPFLRVICTPQVFHLAGVANLIKSTMESPVSIAQCNHLVQKLRAMAEIVSGIEGGIAAEMSLAKGLHEKTAILIAFANHFSSDAQNASQSLRSLSPENSNIDPTLQSSIGLLPSGETSDQQEGGVNHVSEAQQQPELYYQLPPAIIENWPWDFDIYRGFGKN